MKDSPKILILDALDTLNLPVLVSYEDIKERYYELSKMEHPDINQRESRMRAINEAYSVLKRYIFLYRFSFSDEEIMRQFPQESYDDRFRF